MNIQDILSHIDLNISDEIRAFAHESFTHYLFVYRIGKRQYGYCTHCGSVSKTTGLIHSYETRCPACEHKCVVRYAGLRRSKLIDQIYVTYFEKSKINPQVVIAKGILAVRDYSGDYRDVKTQFLIRALYVFKMDGSIMAARWGYYSWAKVMTYGEWEIRKSVFPLDYVGSLANIPSAMSWDSIAAAVKGTQFQYSGWESYRQYEMIKFFDMFIRWPCVEYLTKLGLETIVGDKLAGNPTYRAINWRGKTLQQVVGLTRSELKMIKAKGINVNALYIKLNRISKKDGSNLNPEQIKQIMNSVGYCSRFFSILKYTKIIKAFEYLKKQYKNLKKHFYGQEEVIIWDDYIKDCITLGMDLTDENNLFPRDLYQAHQNTIKQIKIKADELLNAKIVQRVEVLKKKYCFEYNGLLIRPVINTDELIAEGKALHHCVGTYAKSYAEGKTDLLVIRDKTNPDKPFFTMEVYKGNISQTRGKYNCSPDEAVKAFIEEFEKQKLHKHEKDVRVRIAV